FVMLRAMRAQRRAKAPIPAGVDQKSIPEAAASEDSDPSRAQRPVRRHGPMAPEGEQPPGRRAGQAVAGLLAVLLVVAGTAAADPVGLGWTAAPTGDADAPVQTVQVAAANMRFTPDRIEVPAGTR